MVTPQEGLHKVTIIQLTSQGPTHTFFPTLLPFSQVIWAVFCCPKLDPKLLASFSHDSAKTLPKSLPSPLWGFASGQVALVPGQPLIFLPGILHCHICQSEVSDPIWLLFWATGRLPRTARTPQLMIWGHIASLSILT